MTRDVRVTISGATKDDPPHVFELEGATATDNEIYQHFGGFARAFLRHLKAPRVSIETIRTKEAAPSPAP